jgi:hypothetical protein
MAAGDSDERTSRELFVGSPCLVFFRDSMRKQIYQLMSKKPTASPLSHRSLEISGPEKHGLENESRHAPGAPSLGAGGKDSET